MTRTDPSVLEPDGQDRWRHIERLFHVAMDMPEQARMEYLDEEAGADDRLRTDLLALLEADAGAHRRLDHVVQAAIVSWLRTSRR